MKRKRSYSRTQSAAHAWFGLTLHMGERLEKCDDIGCWVCLVERLFAWVIDAIDVHPWASKFKTVGGPLIFAFLVPFVAQHKAQQCR